MIDGVVWVKRCHRLRWNFGRVDLELLFIPHNAHEHLQVIRVLTDKGSNVVGSYVRLDKLCMGWVDHVQLKIK